MPHRTRLAKHHQKPSQSSKQTTNTPKRTVFPEGWRTQHSTKSNSWRTQYECHDESPSSSTVACVRLHAKSTYCTNFWTWIESRLLGSHSGWRSMLFFPGTVWTTSLPVTPSRSGISEAVKYLPWLLLRRKTLPLFRTNSTNHIAFLLDDLWLAVSLSSSATKWRIDCFLLAKTLITYVYIMQWKLQPLFFINGCVNYCNEFI